MAGYYNYSMSNNAVEAYNDGEKPLSKWNKTAILEAVSEAVDAQELVLKFDIALLKRIKLAVLKEELLYVSSWHHTSKHFNKTDFYSVDTEKLEELTADDITKMLNVKTCKKVEEVAEIWKCSFLEWTGSRNHPKATEYTETGTIRGKWFYRNDGTKKSITANGFKKICKINL